MLAEKITLRISVEASDVSTIISIRANVAAANMTGNVRGTMIGAIFFINYNLFTQLPILVHTELSHKILALGSLGIPKEYILIIPTMLDSCSVINVAQLGWFLVIIQHHPYTFRLIIDYKDGWYSPLEMGGVAGHA